MTSEDVTSGKYQYLFIYLFIDFDFWNFNFRSLFNKITNYWFVRALGTVLVFCKRFSQSLTSPRYIVIHKRCNTQPREKLKGSKVFKCSFKAVQCYHNTRIPASFFDNISTHRYLNNSLFEGLWFSSRQTLHFLKIL